MFFSAQSGIAYALGITPTLNDRYCVSNHLSAFCFQNFVQNNTKETQKVRITVPLWGESLQKGIVTGKMFPLMTP